MHVQYHTTGYNAVTSLTNILPVLWSLGQAKHAVEHVTCSTGQQ